MCVGVLKISRNFSIKKKSLEKTIKMFDLITGCLKNVKKDDEKFIKNK